MAVRGIRGATTVTVDEREEILAATRELLEEIVRVNALATEDVAAAIFTVTDDVKAAFPAAAARAMGWTAVPLLDAQEIPVPGSLSHCIRVLLLVNTERPQAAIHHVYLRSAASLREDLLAGRRIPT
jgi:chorismate mutase